MCCIKLFHLSLYLLYWVSNALCLQIKRLKWQCWDLRSGLLESTTTVLFWSIAHTASLTQCAPGMVCVGFLFRAISLWLASLALYHCLLCIEVSTSCHMPFFTVLFITWNKIRSLSNETGGMSAWYCNLCLESKFAELSVGIGLSLPVWLLSQTCLCQD